MAWTAPMTAVANATFTAAQFNTNVRDNLNETAPAKATTASRYFVATGLNAIAERELAEDIVDTAESTTSTGFTDLATTGPSVTVTTGTSALYVMTSRISNSTAGQSGFIGMAVSGASTVAANEEQTLIHQSSNANEIIRASVVQVATGLTPGSNVFTMKYRASGGTANFRYRRLTVMAF